MFNIPRRTFFILLFVVLMIMLQGLFLRGLIVKEFQYYFEGEREAFARLAASDLEVKYLLSRKAESVIKRSGNILLGWSIVMACLATTAVFFVSLKTSGSKGKTGRAPATGSNARPNEGPPVQVKREANPLPGTGAEMTVRSGNVVSAVAGEEEPETEPDELLVLIDEDLRTLPVDPDRLGKIVKGLEELAKAQAVRNTLQKQPIELAQCLNSIIEQTRASVQEREITFHLECDSGLSPSMDIGCLKQIMTNLLDNAVKAVNKEGTVWVSATAEGGQVLFSIKDTGTGIRRKDLPHIFERFYRASGNGLGLGLTIVKELVDACAGTIEVQTARGKGSTFTVRLPMS